MKYSKLVSSPPPRPASSMARFKNVNQSRNNNNNYNILRLVIFPFRLSNTKINTFYYQSAGRTTGEPD